MGTEQQVAQQFVDGRHLATGFADYPGPLPADLDAAYAVQAAAIDLWQDRLAGWKVGRIASPLAGMLGADRFVGPIFARDIVAARDTDDFPAITNGFAAFEAELVIVAAADAPAAKTVWSIEEAASLAGAMHIAVEVAGSPLASINDLGTLATVAGFGNNIGLILGAVVNDWALRPIATMLCMTTIDGRVAGGASAAAIPGGPLAAFAFALGQCARLGRPIRSGDLVSTGAVTGVHIVAIGQRCEADFGDLGSIACKVMKAIAPPAH